MSPASIDVEFRSMSPSMGGSIELMEILLELFKSALQNGKDYELIQSYIGLFLKVRPYEFCKEISPLYQIIPEM